MKYKIGDKVKVIEMTPEVSEDGIRLARVTDSVVLSTYKTKEAKVGDVIGKKKDKGGKEQDILEISDNPSRDYYVLEGIDGMIEEEYLAKNDKDVDKVLTKYDYQRFD